AAARVRRGRGAAWGARTADAGPSGSPTACGCLRPRRAPRPRAVDSWTCTLPCRAGSPELSGAPELGGEVSNLDLGLQRTPCCRYTTPDRRCHATSDARGHLTALCPVRSERGQAVSCRTPWAH